MSGEYEVNQARLEAVGHVENALFEVRAHGWRMPAGETVESMALYFADKDAASALVNEQIPEVSKRMSELFVIDS